MQEMLIKQVSLHCVILILPWNTNKIQIQISWVEQSTKGKSRGNKILSRNIYLLMKLQFQLFQEIINEPIKVPLSSHLTKGGFGGGGSKAILAMPKWTGHFSERVFP